MSSFLCFICDGEVNYETREETREKYREVIGMILCQDSNLCFICCHMLNKLFLFRSICLKRSLRYPVIFSDKNTINLQRSNVEYFALCPDDCNQYQLQKNVYHLTYNDVNYEHDNDGNEYHTLDDDDKFQDYLNHLQTDDKELDYNLTEFENIKNNEDYNSELTDTNENNDEDLANDDFEINDTEVDNDISNNDNNEQDIIDSINSTDNEVQIDLKKKNKKSYKTKKIYKKIILSLEEQKMELEAKRREKKYVEAEFKCYNCALGFLFKDTYQAHMMRHEESNGEFQCTTCTLRFATVTLLRAHTASHTERYNCTKCGLSFKPRSKSLHLCGKRKEIQSVTCQICGNLFKDSNGLQQHLKRVHASKAGGRMLSCVVCGESYNNQAALRTHMIKHIKRKFNCDQCPAVYSSPYTLTQHKRTHADTRMHFCDTCGLGYSSRKSLMAHKRNTINHQQTMFECPICSRTCPNQRSLASHIQTVHSTSKEYKCSRCPARYTSRKSLVRHLRSHQGGAVVKVAICHLCGGTFKGNNKLNRHLREVCEKEKNDEMETTSLYE